MTGALERKLAHRDKFVYKLVQDMPGGCEGNEIVFPDNETPIKFIVELNLLEATKLLSALMTGADLSYPNESHEVVWIWLRQLECPVSICDEITECLEPLFEALSAQIAAVGSGVSSVTNILQGNVNEAPAPVQRNIAGERCGGASFVVDFMDSENRRIYAEAEDGLLDDLAEAVAAVLRAIPVISELPIDEMIEGVNFYFENQVADYITDFELLRDDLIGSLACFIEANGNMFDFQVWGDWLLWVGANYDANRAGKVFGLFAPLRLTFANNIAAEVFNEPSLEEWFINIQAEYVAGSQVAIACPTFTCPDFPEDAVPVLATSGTCIDMPAGENIVDDGGNFWIVTATDTGGDWQVSIRDTDGRPFYLSEITYPDGTPSTCRVLNRVSGGCLTECTDEQDPSVPVTEYSWTWSAVQTVRFKMLLAL